MNHTTYKYSIIFLIEEKHDDFLQFLEKTYELLSSRSDSFEILILDNGTGYSMKNYQPRLLNLNCPLKAFALSKRTSQAVCLKGLLKECHGEILIVFGSHQQITEDSFIHLLDSLDNGTDIVSPVRQNRVDPIFNQLQSRVFNSLVKRITKTNVNDLSCFVRIFRREVLAETELYGDMYRYLPIFAERRGFKSKEVECINYQATSKTGLYGIKEYLDRIVGIFSLYFNTRFTRKPLRFFSAIGFIFFLIGIFILLYVFAEKFLLGKFIGNRNSLILATFLMVIGIQSASVGLLGEIIAFTHGRHKKEYVIGKKFDI
ncbi:MAG: glycosyltransferase [Nitrospirota bacterium]